MPGALDYTCDERSALKQCHFNQNPFFPQAQMVRRVKAYLKSMKVITDEEELHRMSQEVEPPSGGLAPPPLPVLNTVKTQTGKKDFVNIKYKSR